MDTTLISDVYYSDGLKSHTLISSPRRPTEGVLFFLRQSHLQVSFEYNYHTIDGNRHRIIQQVGTHFFLAQKSSEQRLAVYTGSSHLNSTPSILTTRITKLSNLCNAAPGSCFEPSADGGTYPLQDSGALCDTPP